MCVYFIGGRFLSCTLALSRQPVKANVRFQKMMKIIQSMVPLLTLCFIGCASSSGYFIDRGRDAADIFTATTGVGLGARIRVGPIHITPLMFHNDKAGLRGGVFFNSDKGPPALVDYGVTDIGFLFFLSSEGFAREWYQPEWGSKETLECAKQRGKSFGAGSLMPLLSWPNSALITEDNEDYIVYPAYYFTQIEILLAIVPSLRLGFNPGELLDFILGWTTIDIFNDDLENRQKNKGFDDIGTHALTSQP